ncbi:MAG: DsbA family protein [Rickettsia endosymbiont of Ixodes persulcatus]|nr:DsbA family protein [Rickettsia endosymbiont of Ixodes persulcatus]MCZ6903103.1 DsbA family protein [Rickettsia endosymbiont of Ixodes persulcatus]MCZ6911034.1 DsbA family protein [Rickettsia endosymbiont of Ixodes persulcatus]MCZ6914846.1 DsbA family protein [Rickettsia endosymbiont of Ixodes persulcatus]MCZ6919489.1 DsbA family protein [Rickettsia endosymbiont of Ixodes persulcatus]
MQYIIGKILVIFVIIVGVLFIFKTIKTYSTKSVSVEVKQSENARKCEEERVQEIIKDYLLKTPEIIIESIEGLQKRKVQENETKVNNYLKDNKLGIEDSQSFPIIGNNDGDVTIIAFYDYNCSYCKKGDIFINEVLQNDPKVKVVLRPFPILGDASEYLARISLAVYKINSSKFKVVHDALMKIRNISKESIKELLTENGLNATEIEETADSTEIKDLITQNIKIARSLRIQGVPAYIIDTKLIPGLIDFLQLLNIVKEIRDNKSS